MDSWPSSVAVSRLLSLRLIAVMMGLFLASSAPQLQPWSREAWSLSNCMVRTTASLYFRASPAGSVIGGIRKTALLTALERTADWFLVDYHRARLDKRGFRRAARRLRLKETHRWSRHAYGRIGLPPRINATSPLFPPSGC